MTNDIFNLFNLVDERAQAEKEEKERKEALEKEKRAAELAEKMKNAPVSDAKEKPQTKTKTKKDDVFAPNENTVIRYFGESIEITRYFTSEELAEGLLVKKKDVEPVRKPLEAEMLRKKMEKEFPELVKSHTEIIFLEGKNLIIPTMKAKKKGNSEQVLSSDSTSLFSTKIPFSILFDFIAVAKQFGALNVEVHADIYYDSHNANYFMDIPKQKVHPVWVEVTEDAYSIVERVEDAIKVLEIHSHHSMAPTPSSLDNQSERVPGMHYAIVGHTNNFFPSIYLRQFISEEIEHISVPFDKLFDCPFQYTPKAVNLDWIEVATE